MENLNHNSIGRRFISQAGLSILELMTALALLLIVSASIMGSLLGMMKVQAQVSNRTEMHSSVRSATELLEQEISQAGRITLPAAVYLTNSTGVTAGSTSMTVGSATGMFAGELLTVDSGTNQETVTISSISGSILTVSAFQYAHALNVPVQALGAFGTGVVPPALTNGSSGTVLKLYGDINGDGNMLYVEYTCDTTAGKLYRNSMAFDTPAANKLAKNDSMVLLNNIISNPGGTACFTYQTPTNNTGYVIDVAVTLTIQTQNINQQTGVYDQETKALLNIAPRNIFAAYYQYASLSNRVQPMPASVASLLP
jgi:hypothetical protein